jgi:hypothetical protein
MSRFVSEYTYGQWKANYIEYTSSVDSKNLAFVNSNKYSNLHGSDMLTVSEAHGYGMVLAVRHNDKLL